MPKSTQQQLRELQRRARADFLIVHGAKYVSPSTPLATAVMTITTFLGLDACVVDARWLGNPDTGARPLQVRMSCETEKRRVRDAARNIKPTGVFFDDDLSESEREVRKARRLRQKQLLALPFPVVIADPQSPPPASPPRTEDRRQSTTPLPPDSPPPSSSSAAVLEPAPAPLSPVDSRGATRPLSPEPQQQLARGKRPRQTSPKPKRLRRGGTFSAEELSVGPSTPAAGLHTISASEAAAAAAAVQPTLSLALSESEDEPVDATREEPSTSTVPEMSPGPPEAAATPEPPDPDPFVPVVWPRPAWRYIGTNAHRFMLELADNLNQQYAEWEERKRNRKK
jgi:hypothetical protein